MRTNKKTEEILNKVLKVIKIYLDEKGYPPSVRELKQEMDVSSTSTIHYYLSKLEEKGQIRRTNNKNRAIEIVKNYYEKEENNKVKKIPLLGEVAAGRPILAYENYEEVYEFSDNFFKSGELFMLTGKGDSMIEAGIFNGDKIIVRRQQTAENGDIVVALVNEDEAATVKRFFRKDGQIVLHPENEALADMIYPAEQVSILGKVVGLMRNYRS